jgi:hypothetical protein
MQEKEKAKYRGCQPNPEKDATPIQNHESNRLPPPIRGSVGSPDDTNRHTVVPLPSKTVAEVRPGKHRSTSAAGKESNLKGQYWWS